MSELSFTNSTGDSITTSDAELIDFIEKCEDAGLPWRTYSGRGMYGKITVGITVGGDISLDDLADAGVRMKPMRTDSMGFSTIYYFHR